jgi:hypothetical protein
MAKLSARGRKIIFEVEKEVGEKGVSEGPHRWEKTNIALGSDGVILKKWTADIKGVGVHDYGWKVLGKVKAGLSAEAALEIYCKKGFTIKSAPGLGSDARSYCNTVSGAVAAGIVPPARTSPMTGTAMRTEEKAQRERAKKEKAATKRAEVVAIKNGAGFYVLNETVGLLPVADHPNPFASYEEAEEFAWERYRSLVDSRFDYLLPVRIIEAGSRSKAQYGNGHVWWVNGKKKGGPSHPGQMGLPGMNGNLL